MFRNPIRKWNKNVTCNWHYWQNFLTFSSSVLDPYGIMAMLGFLVFLFYLIYNYLNANGNAGSGRNIFHQFHKISQNSDIQQMVWTSLNKFHESWGTILKSYVLLLVRKVLWVNLKNFAVSWNIRQNWKLPYKAVANIPLDMVNTSCLECIFHPKTNANLIQHQIQVLACTVSDFMLWKNLWDLKEILCRSHFHVMSYHL